LSGPWVRCKVTRPGHYERNGLGAVREVSAPGLRYVEEITWFEPGKRMDYLIRKCTLPMRHHGGRLDFMPREGGTDIQWVTEYTVSVPLVRGLWGAMIDRAALPAFTRFLTAAKAELEGGGERA
jgi:hypothetical protein